MTAAGQYRVLLPADLGSAGHGPGLGDRLGGLCGRERMLFPSLKADPSRLAGVLLVSGGEPGSVTVNGLAATVLWKGRRRLLLTPGPFKRFENVVTLGQGAGEVMLAPVVANGAGVEELGLPAGSSWRMQTLDGLDQNDIRIPRQPQAPGHDVLAGLARGLLAMLTPEGDVWSFYDLPGQTYRLAGWRWDTGIVLEALAVAAGRGILQGLERATLVVGDRLLATRLDHRDCPGGFPEWTDLRHSQSGKLVSQWVVPFNASFIAAGLVRLAGLTGRQDYRLAARDGLRLASAALTPAGGLRGYYFEMTRQWRYLGQINDSGMLGRGLALFPGKAWALDAARKAGEYLLNKAADPDGHIGRAWWDPAGAAAPGQPLFPEWKAHPGRVVAKVFMRGQAWALMGLTGALRLGAGERTRQGTRDLTDFILGAQQADGSWLYSQLEAHMGSCAKTTAALALALAEWSAFAGDGRARAAASRALEFLDSCRRPDTVPAELAGMPVDESSEGCIIYFRKRPVVCAYCAALELLARLALGDGE